MFIDSFYNRYMLSICLEFMLKTLFNRGIIKEA